ncbi:MAG: hypothetical protein HKP61_16575 [Dactylosporangium sp.]|nr:FeoC-like transcriptional regulator [Dactylosporangium sp.]NNJ62522.1 hypothetical protein [Dactylosporangium sp.]
MSTLRAVLSAVLTAAPGTGLDDIARGLELSRDEVDAMVGYWERRGELTVDRLLGCSASGCGGCPVAPDRAWCRRPAGGDRPGLLAISPGRRGGERGA